MFFEAVQPPWRPVDVVGELFLWLTPADYFGVR